MYTDEEEEEEEEQEEEEEEQQQQQRGEEELRAWIRSPQQSFTVTTKAALTKGRELGLSSARVRRILLSDPEKTRSSPGSLKRSQVAFRPRLWSRAQVDLGFVNFNSRSYGIFLLGKLFCCSIRRRALRAPSGDNE